jgi:hypothetical protein
MAPEQALTLDITDDRPRVENSLPPWDFGTSRPIMPSRLMKSMISAGTRRVSPMV